MEAVDAMDAQTLEKDTIDRPQINPWRLKPTSAQVRYATSLCRTELSYAERIRTIDLFAMLDINEMSELITRLEGVRARRLKRLRRLAGRRR